MNLDKMLDEFFKRVFDPKLLRIIVEAKLSVVEHAVNKLEEHVQDIRNTITAALVRGNLPRSIDDVGSYFERNQDMLEKLQWHAMHVRTYSQLLDRFVEEFTGERFAKDSRGVLKMRQKQMQVMLDVDAVVTKIIDQFKERV